MKIFISHSSKDAEYVQFLMVFLRVGLVLSADDIRATSLEQTQLAGGANVVEVLREEILASDAFIAVLSPTSLHSQYVLFELGARWGANKKMFPILLPSVDMNQIFGPLKAFQILKSDQSGLWNLIENIGVTLNLKPESPRTVQNEINNLLRCSTTTYAPLAFAVLSYVVDKKLNFALLKDPHYKRIQPPGRRLEANEYPDEIALRIASEDLDLPIEELTRFPKFSPTIYDQTRVVAPPYQVQVEKNLHRTALVHYDFVYVFYVDRVKPPISVRAIRHKSDPQWYSVAEVKRLQASKEYAPHDCFPTMKKIVAELQDELQHSRAPRARGRRKS
jgi:TIR domain